VAQLIDTSAFIALEWRQLTLDLLACSFPAACIDLAAITASELLAGVYRADAEHPQHRWQAFIEQILNTLPVITFDLSSVRV